ncbi:MAG: ion transporter [Cyclobacteriaceae bacterium]
MPNHRVRLGEFLEGKRFHNFIISLIVLNSITIGMQTSKSWMESYGMYFEGLDDIILGVFIVEVVLKLYAFGYKYFLNSWNVFDFLIVVISVIPASGPFSVFRTLRILRTLRLINNVPKLRLIIEALLKSIPSIGWISLLLMVVFYIFAVLGTNVYGEAFPELFGDLGSSMFTLFQIMTLESWSSGIARPMMETMPYAYLFFVPFILIATYTTLNIFIAIVVNTMNEMHHQDNLEEEQNIKEFVHGEHENTLVKLDSLQKKVDQILERLDKGK